MGDDYDGTGARWTCAYCSKGNQTGAKFTWDNRQETSERKPTDKLGVGGNATVA